MPGRGAALTTPRSKWPRAWPKRATSSPTCIASVQEGVAAGKDLNAVYKDTFAKLKPKYGHWVIFDHCMPFDVTRCYDEVTQYPDPRIWTAERDLEMWKRSSPEPSSSLNQRAGRARHTPLPRQPHSQRET